MQKAARLNRTLSVIGGGRACLKLEKFLREGVWGPPNITK